MDGIQSIEAKPYNHNGLTISHKGNTLATSFTSTLFKKFNQESIFDQSIYFQSKSTISSKKHISKSKATHWFSDLLQNTKQESTPFSPDIQSQIRGYMFDGIYIGIVLVIMLYGFFSYITLKEKEYLYFICYTLVLGILFTISNERILPYNGADESLRFTISNILFSLAGIVSILFTMTFFKTKYRTPKRHIWLIGLIGIFILCIIMSLVGFTPTAFGINQYNSLFSLVFAFFIGFAVFRQGFKPAGFYLMAWGVFTLAFGFYFSRNILGYDIYYFRSNELQIGSALQLIFICFALIKKINTYLELKNEAQTLALKTALENEQLIQDQKEMLETRVKERTIDLQHTIKTLHTQREKLKEANIFKDKVFSVISHDLKSPVSTLTGLVELLNMKSLSEDEKFKILENINVALKNTRHLLENILAWANPENKQADKFERVEIRNLVNEVFDLFKIHAELKNLSLINNISKETIIMSDHNMLMIVLRNFVSNALKYTMGGGTIRVELQEESGNISISVIDTGMGMKQETMQKLFKANERFSTRGTRNEKGTGIGLMLCKEFVEKLNGYIEVESEYEKGSTFRFILKNAATKTLSFQE